MCFFFSFRIKLRISIFPANHTSNYLSHQLQKALIGFYTACTMENVIASSVFVQDQDISFGGCYSLLISLELSVLLLSVLETLLIEFWGCSAFKFTRSYLWLLLPCFIWNDEQKRWKWMNEWEKRVKNGTFFPLLSLINYNRHNLKCVFLKNKRFSI